MNKKHLFLLTLILAVLGVLVTIKQSRPPAELTREEYTSLDLSFDAANVSQITISKMGTPGAELRKEQGKWVLPQFFGARANGDKVDTLLKEIREANGEARGRSKDVFKDFGIEDGEALNIKLASAAGAEILSFLVGTKKADGGNVFVRKKNAENVYLSQSNLLSAAGIYGDLKTENPQNDFWASTDFLQVDSGKVLSLKVARSAGGREETPIHIKRADLNAPWQPAAGTGVFPLSADKVKAYFENAKSWSAEKALDPKAQDYGFSKPFWVLEAGLDGGGVFKVTVSHPKEGPDYFAEVTGEPVVFKIPEYLIKNMNNDESLFFQENPFEADAGQIEKLIIRSGKTEHRFAPKQKTWEALTNYINDLKNFHVNRLLLDPAEAKKASGQNQLEVHKTGQPVRILEAGELIASGDTKEYAAQLRGVNPAFTIREDSYKQLFENLDRLKEPEPAPAPTASPSPAPAAKS